MFGFGKKLGLSFSLKRLVGISGIKSSIARKTGVPLTKGGLERNIGRDIIAGLKNIIGGEISEYTKLQAQSREQAMSRMIKDAERMGADAIVNVRLSTYMV